MMKRKFPKIVYFLICFLLIFEQSGFAQVAGQLDISSYFSGLGNVLTQDKFRPLHLRYLAYDNTSNNLKLLLDKGDLKFPPDQKLESSTKELLSYFFVGISLPNDSFWVNLRPDSPDNIIDGYLAQTDLGKVLLEADLQLKKDTANFTSPQTPEGKAYWKKLYQKASELFGSENITIPTLTRPWIVPGEIIIRETQENAYVYKATLKVMLEQDYLKDSTTYSFADERSKQLNEYASELIRKTIIPKLTKDVNSAKRYAPLRQVYYSLILAQWFKQKFSGKNGLYSQLINKKNLSGLTSKESWSKNTYFQAYQKSFQKGEYNIKESVYVLGGGQTIRNYMSGGISIGEDVIRGAIKSGMEVTGNLRPIATTFNHQITGQLSPGTLQDPNSGEIEILQQEPFGLFTSSSPVVVKEVDYDSGDYKSNKELFIKIHGDNGILVPSGNWGIIDLSSTLSVLKTFDAANCIVSLLIDNESTEGIMGHYPYVVSEYSDKNLNTGFYGYIEGVKRIINPNTRYTLYLFGGKPMRYKNDTIEKSVEDARRNKVAVIKAFNDALGERIDTVVDKTALGFEVLDWLMVDIKNKEITYHYIDSLIEGSSVFSPVSVSSPVIMSEEFQQQSTSSSPVFTAKEKDDLDDALKIMDSLGNNAWQEKGLGEKILPVLIRGLKEKNQYRYRFGDSFDLRRWKGPDPVLKVIKALAMLSSQWGNFSEEIIPILKKTFFRASNEDVSEAAAEALGNGLYGIGRAEKILPIFLEAIEDGFLSNLRVTTANVPENFNALLEHYIGGKGKTWTENIDYDHSSDFYDKNNIRENALWALVGHSSRWGGFSGRIIYALNKILFKSRSSNLRTAAISVLTSAVLEGGDFAKKVLPVFIEVLRDVKLQGSHDEVVKALVECAAQWGEHTEEIVPLLGEEIGGERFYEVLYNAQRESGLLPRELTNGLLKSLRTKWSVLYNIKGSASEVIDVGTYQKFYAALPILLNESFHAGKTQENSKFYLNEHTLTHLARNPGKINDIVSLLKDIPRLDELLSSNYSDPVLMAKSIFRQEDAKGFAMSIIERFFNPEFTKRFLTAREPINVFYWSEKFADLEVEKPYDLIEKLMTKIKNIDASRVFETTEFLMKNHKGFDLDIAISYINDMGPHEALKVFEAYTAIMKDDFSDKTLQDAGIRVTGTTAKERAGQGIRQLKDMATQFYGNLLSSGNIDDNIVDNPLKLDLLRLASNFDGSKWKRDYDFKELIQSFLNARKRGKTDNLPDMFYIKDVQGERTLKIGTIRATRLNTEGFSFQPDTIKFFDRIINEIEWSLNLLHLNEADRMKRSKESVLPGIDAELDRVKKNLEQLRGNEQALKQAGKQVVDLEGLRIRVNNAAKISDIILALGEFKPKNNTPLAVELRKLLFLQGFHVNNSFAEEYKDRLQSARQISFPSINVFLEFTGNIIKEHVLGDNPELDDAQLGFTIEMKKTLRNYLNFGAFEDERRIMQSKERTKSVELTVVPTRGILGELSGYFSEACWTQQRDIMENNPNMIFLAFVENYNDLLNAKIVGGTLLINTTSNGRQNFVTRGFNPIDSIADYYDMGELFESFQKDYLGSLPGNEARLYSVPDPNSGALTNRPTVKKVVSERLGKHEWLDQFTNFNNYDITRNVYLVQEKLQTNPSSSPIEQKPQKSFIEFATEQQRKDLIDKLSQAARGAEAFLDINKIIKIGHEIIDVWQGSEVITVKFIEELDAVSFLIQNSVPETQNKLKPVVQDLKDYVEFSRKRGPYAEGEFTSSPIKTETGLFGTIKEIINRAGGKVTFAEFMGSALNNEEYGYYAKDVKIGKKGDFTTDAENPKFAAKIADQLLQMWIIMDKPTDFQIVEMGAGTGMLAKNILSYLNNNSAAKQLYDSLKYVIVEINERPRNMQTTNLEPFSGKVAWKSLEELKNIQGVFLSNELVDAFPVHIVKKQDIGFKEVYITIKDGQFVEEMGDLSSLELKAYTEKFKSVAEGQEIAFSPNLSVWQKQISRALDRGFVITIDYGVNKVDDYAQHKNIAWSANKDKISNPRKDIYGTISGGQSTDITWLINFKDIVEEGNRNGLNSVGDAFSLRDSDLSPTNDIGKYASISEDFRVFMQEKGVFSSSPVEQKLELQQLTRTVNKGGIDFRSLPITMQPVLPLAKSAVLSLNSNLSNLNLDKEWREMQDMLKAGIIPSSERIKEYLQSCCEKKDMNQETDKILACIADILRLQEERVVSTDLSLKEMLALLESNKPVNEMQIVLAKIIVEEKEPLAIAQ